MLTIGVFMEKARHSYGGVKKGRFWPVFGGIDLASCQKLVSFLSKTRQLPVKNSLASCQKLVSRISTCCFCVFFVFLVIIYSFLFLLVVFIWTDLVFTPSDRNTTILVDFGPPGRNTPFLGFGGHFGVKKGVFFWGAKWSFFSPLFSRF